MRTMLLLTAATLVAALAVACGIDGEANANEAPGRAADAPTTAQEKHAAAPGEAPIGHGPDTSVGGSDAADTNGVTFEPLAAGGDAGRDAAAGPSGPRCGWTELPTGPFGGPGTGVDAMNGRLVLAAPATADSRIAIVALGNPTQANFGGSEFLARIRIARFSVKGADVGFGMTCENVSSGRVTATTAEYVFARSPSTGQPVVQLWGAGGSAAVDVSDLSDVVLELGRDAGRSFGRVLRNGVELKRGEWPRRAWTRCRLEVKLAADLGVGARAELDDFALTAGAASCVDDFARATTY